MCRNMVDIQSPTAEIRRGKKGKEDRRRKKLQDKNIMAPLLHRAAITSEFDLGVFRVFNYTASLLVLRLVFLVHVYIFPGRLPL